MHEAARITAVIEIISECEASWKTARPSPADIIMNRYFRDRRFIGSKDRGAIAELAYFIIRNYGMLHWWVGRHFATEVKRPTSLEREQSEQPICESADEQGAKYKKNAVPLIVTALLLQNKKTLPDLHNIFNGDHFSPAKLSAPESAYAKAIVGQKLIHHDMPAHVRHNYPAWMESDLRDSLGDEWQKEMEALNTEAPVDLRANTLLTSRDGLLAALKEEGYAVNPTPYSPIGIRMQTRAPIFTSQYFKQGWFEMQDEGSQLVSLLLDAKPGQKIVDFCAGAGGKTLALAACMQNKGRILAWDTSKKRLEQMIPRVKRAKADNIQRHILESEHDAFIKRHKNSVDAVLVDAPCSGSGTWRRNPDLKWRFHEKDLQEILQIQKRILESASRLVKVNGHLLYITCSLLQNENERQVEAFLETQPKFRVVLMEKIWNNIPQQTMRQGGTIRLTPHKDGTDGFFASLLKRCE